MGSRTNLVISVEGAAMGILATAYRRQEGNFIASMKDGIPRREFLIAGSDERRAVLLKFGVTASIAGKERFDIGLRGEVYGFVGAPGDLLQAAEK
jgi:hypothetical protein